MKPDFEKIKKLASEYASTLGYFPGSCAAQNAAGYYCVVDGYIQGYLKALENSLSVLDNLFMEECEITVDEWFRDSQNLFQGREEFIKRMEKWNMFQIILTILCIGFFALSLFILYCIISHLRQKSKYNKDFWMTVIAFILNICATIQALILILK